MAAQGEDYVDGGFDFDWLVVELVGAVAPVLDCGEGSVLKHGVAADYAKVFDGAGGGDGGGQDDCA